MRLTALLCLFSWTVFGQNYRALVIGNELPWASEGARDVAQTLEQLGFDVLHVDNNGRNEFSKVVQQFGQAVQPGDVVIFYYAGRAATSGGSAGLVPVDGANSIDLRGIMLSLDGGHHPAATLVILDVLADQRWLGSVPPPSNGAMIMASARGSGGPHSLTGELLTAMRPQYPLALVVREVQRRLSSNRMDPSAGRLLERDRILGMVPPNIRFGGAGMASVAQANQQPPTSAPPTSAPPTSAPPTSAPPTSAPPTSAPPTSVPPTTSSALQRFPTIDSPGTVTTGARFSVLVSLTIDKITPDVAVRGVGHGVEKTAEGALAFSLPCQPKCEMEVLLSAPGFDFVSNANSVAIEMTADGDSTPARFDLTALHAGAGRLEATFWSHGAFLARAVRTIQVTEFGTMSTMQAPAPAAARTAKVVTVSQPAAPAALPLSTLAPDLTVQWEESTEAGQPQCELTVSSPYLGPVRKTRCVPGAELAKYLAQRYQQLHQLTGRGVQVPGAPKPADRPKLVKDQLRGLGRELYDHFATKVFQEAFWALEDKEKSDPNFHFRTIQIYTNNPVLPWELLVPARTDGSDARGFLGVDFAVARWHIGERINDLPPLELALHQVVALAPKYQGPAYLAHQQEELQSISGLPGYERGAGNLQAIFQVLDNPPAGIVHFAGHGYARQAAGSVIFDYGLMFEDAAISPTIWRGHEHPAAHNHPLFVLNACDTGEAQSVAGFVDGWAAAVLESGASGFIGGLWPLGDQGAAQFAKDFYTALHDDLGLGKRASVAGILQVIRGDFLKTGDPTFLAYVFYGDARLAIVP